LVLKKTYFSQGVRKTALRQVAFIRTNSFARAVAVGIANLFPSLAVRIKKRLYDDTPSAPPIHFDVHMTPRSARIYQDLKHAIEKLRRNP
jgi:hypothetical protein